MGGARCDILLNVLNFPNLYRAIIACSSQEKSLVIHDCDCIDGVFMLVQRCHKQTLRPQIRFISGHKLL